MTAPVWAASACRSDAGSHRSAVPEVTFCGARIAIDAGSAQHVAMREFFRNLLQPLNLAGFFLRPGFGAAVDFDRVARLWKVFLEGPIHGNKEAVALDNDAMVLVMSSKEGRRTVWRILKTTGFFLTSFTGNSETFFSAASSWSCRYAA